MSDSTTTADRPPEDDGKPSGEDQHPTLYHVDPPGDPGGTLAEIGGYRILRVIGAGGMGTVYEAEQENPRRIVALKVINSGFTTDSRLRRFEQEAQILGRLQHPGIAQVYEAGTADAGRGVQPYFAMELVRGKMLDEHAAEKKLPLLREALQIWRKSLGEEHPNVAAALMNLGLVLLDRGDRAGAEPLLRESLAIRSKVLGEESLDFAKSANALGVFLIEKGNLAEAESLLRKTMEIRSKKLPPRHGDIGTALAGLGLCLIRQGRYAEAQPLLVEALSIREEKLPPGHWARFETQSLLGEALTGQRKFEEAESLLLPAYDGLKDKEAVPPARKLAARSRIERLYASWGRPHKEIRGQEP